MLGLTPLKRATEKKMSEFERAEPASKNVFTSAGMDAKLLGGLVLVALPAAGVWYMWKVGWLENWTVRAGVVLIAMVILTLVIMALSGRRHFEVEHSAESENGVYTIRLRASGKKLENTIRVKAHIVLYKSIKGKPNISPGFLASTELERDDNDDRCFAGSLTVSRKKIGGRGFRTSNMEPGILVIADGRSELFEAPISGTDRLF